MNTSVDDLPEFSKRVCASSRERYFCRDPQLRTVHRPGELPAPTAAYRGRKQPRAKHRMSEKTLKTLFLNYFGDRSLWLPR